MGFSRDLRNMVRKRLLEESGRTSADVNYKLCSEYNLEGRVDDAVEEVIKHLVAIGTRDVTLPRKKIE